MISGRAILRILNARLRAGGFSSGRRLPLLALLLLLATPTLAPAQQFPLTLPANTVYGRLGVGAGPGQAIPFNVFSSNILIGKVYFAKDYGAVCDGVTDDTGAIQAAVTAAAGNELRFPSGQCLVAGTITNTNNVPMHIVRDLPAIR